MFTFNVYAQAGSFARVISVTVPKNCIKYAEDSLRGADSSIQVLPRLSKFVGKNLLKMEEKEPGTYKSEFKKLFTALTKILEEGLRSLHYI